ncbi:restriction endonuclease subunit S [Glaesserella parasuis]|uniref:Type I restriction-modification system subunit S n=1 Tax=Glaesserella parasuis HPS9 TaxID=1450513 RepID=A0A836YYV1_GLAPU|nr:restriction endonuclease subunit S [Glaesserella parasuis]KDB44443.1 type I restriction-modification system subunit S [Glaesserella parasuis HPS9]
MELITLENAGIEFIDGDRGKNYPKIDEFKEQGYCLFLSAKNVTNKGFLFDEKLFISQEKDGLLRKGKLSRGDIVITTRGTVGNVALYNDIVPFDNIRINSGMVILRCNQQKYSTVFLDIVFRSEFFQNQIKGLVSGSAVPQLPIKDLKNLKMPNLSLENQKKVIDMVGRLENKIQLNTQINQTLEQIAQTIFKSWFIDFDPVHAKANALASGQTLEQATQAAMAVISGKNTQELHRLQTANPEQYQQLWEIAEAFPSGVDEEGVPWGWESKKVGEVAKIIKGKSYKSSELAPSKTALVTLKSFNRGGGYRLDGLKEYTGNYKEEQEVFAGDLIIAYTDVTQAADVIGKPAMVMSDSCYEHLVISLDVGVVRPKNEKHKYFLYCLAMTDTFQAHTHSFCTGTTVLHLGKDAVPSFEFILPDNKFIELFDEFVLPIFVRINNIIEENKSLEKIRDELLPKLLSGEV